MTRHIEIERRTVISAQPFDRVVARLEILIGRPDMHAFGRNVAAARTFADLERIIHEATGAAGLMEMARFDAGQVLRKETGRDTPLIVRFLIGNPLVMRQMAAHVPDAAAYAPVTVLVDQRADGVHLSYDSMVSLLAPYDSPEALVVARDLDAKVMALLTAVTAEER